MKFRTEVNIPQAPFTIEPLEDILFIGSCFADNIGKRFTEEQFKTMVNPYGVMYNPASILHTVQRLCEERPYHPFSTAVFTLGTNHVYIEKSTGEIVDNCRKRPQRLFEERELTIEECTGYLNKAVLLLRQCNPNTRFILTVSPIRYAKYGYHENQLSKATLLLSVNRLLAESSMDSPIYYFPAYEIVLDELRDYRFYQSDMLHPSEQAVDYIYERLTDTLFSKATHAFLKEWEPIRKALSHRPFNPDSDEYRSFLQGIRERTESLRQRYPSLSISI